MFLADSHGRDNVSTATVALDTDGIMLALKIETVANLGAFCSAVGPFVPTMGGGRVVGTVYRSPHIYHSVRCVFTNTMPVAAYRGAGRPEAAYLMERLMERAAEETGIESRELRRRNFIREEDLPYMNLAGIPIRSGAFAETMDLALARAEWETFDVRRQASVVRDKLRGIGFGCYVESSGGGPEEEARVSIAGDGNVEITVGTYSHGQGHATAFAQIAHERLGVNIDRIRLIQGDTREVRFGGGTGGSRSSQMGGIAVLRAADGVIEHGKPIAAELLQGDEEVVSFQGGLYRIDDRTVTLEEVAKAALQPQFGGELTHTYRYNRGEGYTFPNGCHVAEVEIDQDTGVVEVVRYTAVDDCGRVINPLLAEGQVQGGVVQGIGQAMLEHVVYDDMGQLLTGSFMDYAMPRATHIPWIDVSFNEVLEPSNELGVKGIGEGGACGAPPAIVHAVLNALARRGVSSIDMPLTSERVWRALNRGP
jgi:carbon-monoxide dehydrogenase large subunit